MTYTASKRLGSRRQQVSRCAIAAAAIAIVLVADIARADSLADLGSYERDASLEVLTAQGLQVEPLPEGKRIHRVLVVNLDVFSAKTGWLQYLNHLHQTTLTRTIERELLVKPGDRWTDARIRESERIMRNPSLSSFVVCIPIASSVPDSVDLLVVTRDVWSLRTNSEFVHQDGNLSFLKIAAAENNLLGRRKHLSLIFEMDQGEYSLSTRWRDLNVLGKRWQLVVRPRLIFGRGSSVFEGTESYTRIEYPLWSLATKWGFFLEATHKDAIARYFEGDRLATYDDPDTDEIESIPEEFRRKDLAIRTELSRSFGHAIKKIVSVGHSLIATRPSLLDTPELPPSTAENFANDLFPRNERSSALTLGLSLFEARYVVYRNLEGYDLPEVRQVGASMNTESALALQPFGSERAFARNSIHASYTLDFGGQALAQLGLTVGRRFEKRDGELASVDSTFGADWYFASPHVVGHRLVTFGVASLRSDVLDNTLVRLGGQDDLRGYKVGQFIGTSFYRASAEIRSLPYKLAFLRVGYLAFYDIGGAGNRIKQIGAHQDVGLGLRALIPQTGESLMFLYWALPFDRDARSFPGRISLGFGKEI